MKGEEEEGEGEEGEEEKRAHGHTCTAFAMMMQKLRDINQTFNSLMRLLQDIRHCIFDTGNKVSTSNCVKWLLNWRPERKGKRERERSEHACQDEKKS